MIDQFIIFGAKYLYLLIFGMAFLFFIKQPRNGKKQIMIFAVVVLPVAYLVSVLISFFYYDPRPFVQGNFIPLILQEPDNGFPSDHILLSAAISAVIFPFNKKSSVILWLLTVLVGLSRILAGLHHCVDVLGSIVIAGGVGFLTWRLLGRRRFLKF